MKRKILVAIAVLAGLAVIAGGILVAVKLFHDKEPDSPRPIGTDPLEQYITDDGGIYFNEDLYGLLVEDEHIVRSNKGIKYINNEITIYCYNGTDFETVENLAIKYNGEISGRVYNKYQIRFTQSYGYEELEQLAEKLKKEPVVETSHVTIILPELTPYSSSNRKRYNEFYLRAKNWGIEAIQADSIWHKYTDKMNYVNVGVFDSSFQADHKDLNFVESPLCNFSADDNNSHGTHVAGIFTALHNNIGISGIAPKVNLYGVSYDGVKANINNFSGYTWIEIVFTYLILMKRAEVINISLGSELAEFSSQYNEDAKKVLVNTSNAISNVLSGLIEKDYNFVICVASGNQGEFDYRKAGEDYRYSPMPLHEYNSLSEQERNDFGYYYGYKQDDKGLLCGIHGATGMFSLITDTRISGRIITVGSIKNTNDGYKIEKTSQIGAGVDILAPGEMIYSTIRTNKYGFKSGTSMASPHVAGVATMMFAVNPNLKGDEVKRIILETATEEYPYAGGSHKLVNAQLAVEEALRCKNGEQPVFDEPPTEPDETTKPEPVTLSEDATAEPNPEGDNAILGTWYNVIYNAPSASHNSSSANYCFSIDFLSSSRISLDWFIPGSDGGGYKEGTYSINNKQIKMVVKEKFSDKVSEYVAEYDVKNGILVLTWIVGDGFDFWDGQKEFFKSKGNNVGEEIDKLYDKRAREFRNTHFCIISDSYNSNASTFSGSIQVENNSVYFYPLWPLPYYDDSYWYSAEDYGNVDCILLISVDVSECRQYEGKTVAVTGEPTLRSSFGLCMDVNSIQIQ